MDGGDRGHGAIVLTREPLDPGDCLAALSTDSGTSGAVVTFTGIARRDHPTGLTAPVSHLEFEAYPEMTQAELARIHAEAHDRYDLTGLAIHHRHGTVPVGAPIVAVAASAAHRAQAFDAASWTMDAVKHRVPLWKREVGTDGSTRWVAGCTVTGKTDPR